MWHIFSEPRDAAVKQCNTGFLTDHKRLSEGENLSF